MTAFERARTESTNAEQSVDRIGTLRADFTVGTIGSVINALDGLVTAIDTVAEVCILSSTVSRERSSYH